MDYAKAIEYIVRRRKDELYKASLIFERALEQNATLSETENEIKRLTLLSAKGEKIDKTALKTLEKQKKEILSSM